MKQRKKNERRIETEKKEFYWRVLDVRLKKWYVRERKKYTKSNVYTDRL